MTRTRTLAEPGWLTEINAALAVSVAGIDPSEWVYGYVRISRDEKDRAEGVQLQAKSQVAHAERKGLALARIMCDNDLSGADADRPGLRELLRLVTAGPSKSTLARDVARLTRDYDLGNELMKLGRDEGVRYLFVKDSEYDLTTGAGRKNFMVKVAEAAEYREVNTENLLDRLSEEAAKGVMQGGSRRFGYGRVVGTHPLTGADVLDRNALRESEVAMLYEGRDRVINGESQTAIITDWNSRGLTAAGGGVWRVGKLTDQLLLEAYVAYDLGEHTDARGRRCECLKNPEGNGIRVHARTGTRHRAQWPAIFTRAEHDAMRAGLRAHRRATDKDRPRQRDAEYWLTGLVGCGGTWAEDSDRASEDCGSWMIGSLLKRKLKNGDQTIQRRYGCKHKDSARRVCGCGRVFRDAGALETYVAQAVIAVYEDPQIIVRDAVRFLADSHQQLLAGNGGSGVGHCLGDCGRNLLDCTVIGVGSTAWNFPQVGGLWCGLLVRHDTASSWPAPYRPQQIVARLSTS
ncbi:recombinase family protein [Nocardia sp. CA-128927]|uniref:recombinase family protein n=1 Tax=Nocardia sp. CA-128927 TaxID=3239975 RepID=UPI003D96F40A